MEAAIATAAAVQYLVFTLRDPVSRFPKALLAHASLQKLTEIGQIKAGEAA
jgi:hypothetical protein